MAEYIKVQNTNQVLTGKELDATALTALVNSTTSPILKPYFRTEQMRTEATEEILLKFQVSDCGAYKWAIDGTPKVTGVTVHTAGTDKFQISIWTYLGNEWLEVFTRGDVAIGTYILKYGDKSKSMIFSTYDAYIPANTSTINVDLIVGSKTYVQIEPTITDTGTFNSNTVWDWIDGGEVVAGDNNSYSGFLNIGSFSAWLDNKEEF